MEKSKPLYEGPATVAAIGQLLYPAERSLVRMRAMESIHARLMYAQQSELRLHPAAFLRVIERLEAEATGL
jgi:hypothetical protein